MGRPPLDSRTLTVREWFELAHPTSTARRPRVFRYVVGLRLTNGKTVHGCAVAGCHRAYRQRTSAFRHVRSGHPNGLQLAREPAKPGTVVSRVDEPADPATTPTEPDITPPDLDPPDLGGVALSMVAALTEERDAWRDRALSAERRLAVVNGAFTAPTSALPVIGGDG